MKATWKGSINIMGVPMLVNIYNPYESSRTTLNDCHIEQDEKGNVTHIGPVGYKPYCKTCGHTFEKGEKKQKGRQIIKNQYVPILTDELEAIKPQSSKTIEIEGYWTEEQLKETGIILYLDTQYLVEPQDLGLQLYRLILNLLTEKQIALYGKICLRTKERLCVILPHRDILFVRTLVYPEEVRAHDLEAIREKVEKIQVGDRELTMGRALLEAISENGKKFEEHEDQYAKNLEQLIKAKMAGQKFEVQTEETKAPAQDLLAQMKAVIETQKAKKNKNKANKKKVKAAPTIKASTSRKKAKTAA